MRKVDSRDLGLGGEAETDMAETDVFELEMAEEETACFDSLALGGEEDRT
jgi:hypothetical protein